ncbi:MAG: hypothetical protein AAFX09_13680 [Pseudomonadota bacterium]
MLWLTWHMWILLALAFAGGALTGWMLRAEPEAGVAENESGEAEDAPEPEPVAEPAPALAAPGASVKPAAARTAEPDASQPDDLSRIKGVGPKLVAALNAAGVTRFSQIAAWSKADVERMDEAVNGRGRIERDDWVGQAKALAG